MDPISLAAMERSRAALDIALTRAAVKPRRLGMSNRELAEYSFARAIRAGDTAATSIESEVSANLRKELPLDARDLLPWGYTLVPFEALARAMASTPGSKGGFAIGSENLGFIDIFRNRSVALALGAQSLPNLRSTVTFGRQTAGVTATWQGADGTSVTAADQTLGQTSLVPHAVVALTDTSEQLLAQGEYAEAFIVNDLTRAIAAALDNATINGAGGAQPIGIKNTVGVTTGQDAASATYAKVLEFAKVAGAANAVGMGPGFVANSAGAVGLQKVFVNSTGSEPIWTGNTWDGQLVGFRAMSSEQAASGNLIFGSWDELVIADWGVLAVALDRSGTLFNTGQVRVRALWLCDVLVRRPSAFVVSTNLS